MGSLGGNFGRKVKGEKGKGEGKGGKGKERQEKENGEEKKGNRKGEEENLKAYSLMLNRGRSENFQNLNFLPYFCSSPLRSTIPKGIWLETLQYEIRAIFTENSRTREFIQHSSLWEQ